MKVKLINYTRDAQESLRVVNAGDFDYVFTEGNDDKAKKNINLVLDQIKAMYQILRGSGQSIEDARGISTRY